MRILQYQEVFACSPSKLFKALHTPSMIQVWWEASKAIVIPQPNGAFAATWGENEDDPDYIVTAVYSAYDPPNLIVITDARYYAKTGPLGFEADFKIEFRITSYDQGALLSLTHSGIPSIPEADEYFEGCDTGWKQCLANIHALLDA